MQKILRKRVFRDLKSNFFRYFSLFSLITIGIYLTVSLIGSAETVIQNVNKVAKESNVEDGQFTVFVPLTKEQIKNIEDKGVSLEEEFFLDFQLKGNSTLRVFKNRKSINLVTVDEGRLARDLNEIVIEKRYSKEHNLSVGDRIEISNKSFEIVGIGTASDYDAMLKEVSDSIVDSIGFGLGFVTDAQYKILKDESNYSNTEETVYSYTLNANMTHDELKDYLCEFKFNKNDVKDKYFLDKLQKAEKEKEEIKSLVIPEYREKTDKFLDEYFKIDVDNLTQFTKSENNPRIKASIDDVAIDRASGLVSGVIIMVLFTYVISVFVIHGIEREISIIGTLYALGVKQKVLLKHYLILPTIITFFAGIGGTILAFSKYGVGSRLSEINGYFSIPNLHSIYPIYLIIYGVIMPPIISLAINYMVINKKLSQPALKMIMKDYKENKVSKINLKNIGFIKKFQIRQFIRELRTSFTVLFGMFISLLIIMLGLDCYVMCKYISVQNKIDTKYEYMYIYKYPEKKAPKDGEKCYTKTLKKEAYGYDLDVTIFGIDKDNPYFDVDTIEGKNKVVIASSTSQKYNLNVGDELVLTDEINEIDYAFTVEKITPYSAGLYVFMDIDSMRELFNQKEDYYNVLLSSKDLNIDTERLYSVNTKEDISKSADVFINNTTSLIITMISTSILIFCVVMYLMIKVMIDRSAFSISLIKIFGFRTGEIRKLYLNTNFYVIAVGAAICIPLAKFIMDRVYPYLVSNVACGINLEFNWKLYLLIYLGIILCYLIINQLLIRNVKKISPAEVLKSRE